MCLKPSFSHVFLIETFQTSGALLVKMRRQRPDPFQVSALLGAIFWGQYGLRLANGKSMCFPTENEAPEAGAI